MVNLFICSDKKWITRNGVALLTLFVVVVGLQYCAPLEQHNVDRITELAPKDYPDDPDMDPSCSDQLYRQRAFSHQDIYFIERKQNLSRFDIVITPGNQESATVMISNICLDEWIPTVPDCLREDEALSKISIFNQQFNRVQVKFTKDDGFLQIDGNNLEAQKTIRVDIAKNCLQMPYWEIITYTRNEQGKDVVLYHGWFNFPMELHTKLLIRKGWSIHDAAEITHLLTRWMAKVPENTIDLGKIRTPTDERKVNLVNRSMERYPHPKGSERSKKQRNIIYPTGTDIMSDFLTNKTQFATFTEPGIYRRVRPWPTQLGRLKNVHTDATVRTTQSQNKRAGKRPEFELSFYDDKGQLTKLVFGGFDFRKLKPKPVEKVNDGDVMAMPMGIANHSFTQSYGELIEPINTATKNPCFAMFLDKDNRWVNSHSLGVDGIAMHLGDQNPREFHIWLLSFERHAFVGHFVIEDDWSAFQ